MRERGLLDETAVSRARSLLQEGKPLEDAVLGADGLGEEAVLRFLAESFELEFIDADRLEKSPPSKEFLSLFPARLLLRHRILPLEERDGVTGIATSRLTATAGLDDLPLAPGRAIAPA